MDTINVNGETYTKVPDEISLFGRTYLLADDTIPEPFGRVGLASNRTGLPYHAQGIHDPTASRRRQA